MSGKISSINATRAPNCVGLTASVPRFGAILNIMASARSTNRGHRSGLNPLLVFVPGAEFACIGRRSVVRVDGSAAKKRQKKNATMLASRPRKSINMPSINCGESVISFVRKSMPLIPSSMSPISAATMMRLRTGKTLHKKFLSIPAPMKSTISFIVVWTVKCVKPGSRTF